MKRLLMAMVLMPLMALAYYTETVNGVDWKYMVSDGSAQIGTGYSSPAIASTTTGAVTIPSTLGGYPVTGIGDDAFADCSGLTSVTIPDGVVRIGERAFWGTALSSIQIPASVVEIGRCAFHSKKMLSITVAADNPSFRVVDGLLLDKEMTTVIVCPLARSGAVVVPSGVVAIGIDAFCKCEKIESITLPAGVVSIGEEAFYGCCGLTSMAIPLGVTSIGDRLFCGCSGLKSVMIPSSVTDIGEDAFSSCESLSTITVAGGNAVYSSHDGILYNKDKSELLLCPLGKSGSVTIPSGVKRIRSYAFSDCCALTSVTMPSSVTCIGDGAFEWCSGLTSMTIPSSVTSIGEDAFYGCDNLQQFVVQSGNVCYKSYDGVLYDLSNNEVLLCPVQKRSVQIAAGTKGIGVYAFADCYELTSVVIPNGLERIGADAFADCEELSQISLPASVVSIGKDAFPRGLATLSVDASNPIYRAQDGVLYDKGKRELVWCSSAQSSVVIPSGIKHIGARAFKGGSALTSVTIPEGVISIGESAFEGCRGLTSIVLPESLLRIEGRAFYDCGFHSIRVPSHVARIGRDAFRGPLESVWIDSLVAPVIEDAFSSNYSSPMWLHIKRGSVGWDWNAEMPDSDIEDEESYVFWSWIGDVKVVYQPNGEEIGDSYGPNEEESDGIVWTYKIVDGMAIVGDSRLRQQNVSGQIIVPPEFDGCPVKRIEPEVFKNCAKITSIVIPDSVVSIGNHAFAGCSGLVSIVLPKGLTRLDEGLFNGCSSLSSVTVPQNVEVVGAGAFTGCSSLVGVLLPEGLKMIEQAAFVSCTALPSIDIPSSVEDLVFERRKAVALCCGRGYIWPSYSEWGNPFLDCARLEEINVDRNNLNYCSRDGVLYDKSQVRLFCCPSGKTTISIPAGVCMIEDDFVGASQSITVDPANKYYSSNNGILYDKKATTLIECPYGMKGAVKIPSGVLVIGPNAFDGCEELTSVTIPSSVTSIGDYAFFGCSGLTSMTIPKGVVSIGESAFEDCYGLMSVTIPSSVTSIGDYAFFCCDGLTSVTIPAGVVSIGDSVFEGCAGLTSIAVDADNPFYSSQDGLLYNKAKSKLICCPGGKTGPVTIPMSMSSLGEYAFYECSGLTSVTIPRGVASIGAHAFHGCSGLTSVTVPSSVTSIGERAFYQCDGLTSVTIPSGVTSIETGVFDDCWSLKVIHVSGGGSIDAVKRLLSESGFDVEGVIFDHGVEVPTYGPWGEAEAVKNPDKLGPTMLTDMALTINGTAGVAGDVVAAFRGDTGTLCGLGKVMDGSGTLSMVCYAPTGTKLHFKVWLSDSPVDNPIVMDGDPKCDLTAPTSGAFLSGHALVVSGDKALTISLRNADWHTVSFNVLPEDPSPAAVFADVKGKVAAVTQGIEFWMPGKTSSLKQIEIGKGYWVNTTVDNVEWIVSGKTDPTVEIALEAGWNLVGYAPEAEGAIQQVLKTALAVKAVDYVTFGVEFYPGGTLKTMEPGKAYWVHATKAYTLVYDGTAGVRALPLRAGVLNVAATPTYGPWGESEAVKNPDKLGPTFLTDMTVSVDGEPAAEGDVVAVFRGDTGALCGLGKVMDDSGTLTVVCYAPKGVKLSFKVWTERTGVTVNCRGCNLIAPDVGAFYSGHTLSASTAGLSATLVPGEKMDYDTGLVGYTASGLPTGLAYNRTTGMITGTATKPGEYAVKFTKSGAETEEMTIVVTAVPKVTVEMVGVNAQSDTNGCKVTGAKEYLVGAKAALTATVPTGTMFEGWFRDGQPWPDEATHQNKSVTCVMGKEDVALIAKFKKERMSVACTWLSEGVFTAGVAAGAGDGILLDDYVTTESGVKSIAVAKLPAGMTYNSTKRIITGFPTKAGTYNVEITVTAKSGAVEKQAIPLTVEALPAWAVGNFAGWTDCGDGTHGTASLSVTAAGAVSGKFLEHGSNWTFTAKSYDVASVTRGENQAYLINAEAVCGKAKRTVDFAVMGLTVDGMVANIGLATGDLGGGETVEMWRNVWAEAEPKAHLATIAGKYTYFLTDGKSEPVALPLSLNGSSALLSGAVKVPWQANRSVTFSTTAFASSNGVEAVFYVAPYKSGATTYPEFFERFTLIPESGEREAGKAHRNPGVLASAVPHAKGGNGTVSVTPAGGQVDAGKTVTLTATAKSDSVFVRWEGTQGSRRFVDPNAKLVLTMDGEHDVFAEAVFRLRTSFDTPEVVVDSAAEYALSRISVGVPVSIRPFVRDEENMLPVKWSAQNLPTGLKIDATTGEITGVATAINSKPIVIIATSVADSKKVGKAELAADVKPEALPAWAVGDFVGTVRCADGTHGTASFTVSAAGKVTNGKLLEHGSNWTFTAASYAASSVTRGAEREFVIVADATCNKAKRAIELHVVDCPSAGVAASASGTSLAVGHFGDNEVELWRNVWKDADAKGIVAGIAGKYTYFLSDGEDAVATQSGEEVALPLNLTSAGVLSGKVNVPARGNASVSFSTTVFASSNGVEAAFYVAPDAKKGYGEIYERFTLVPESGEKEKGKAHRAPGVVAVPESYVSPEGKADTGMGTATVSPAGGQVDAGKTVTVSASPDSKSVFVKWRYAIDGETNFCETAKMTFTMDGEHDVKAWAIFRSKESFAAPVVEVETSEQAKFRALELGVQFSAFVTVEDVENMKPVKWSASNLPSGLKINAETGEISGVATAVNTKPVVITATSVADSKKKTTFTLDIGAQDGKPAALPETAVGTFTGFVNDGTDNLGTFTFTSSEKGALSAKVVDAAGTVSFSGSGFAWSKDGKYGVALTTKKDETLTLTLDSGAGWDKDQLTGTYKTATGLLRNVTSQRNAFSKAWYFVATGDETNGWAFAFTKDAKTAALTVTLKADGTTSIAGKLPNGVDKNGRAATLSVSASGVANAGMMREGAMSADFAPVLTVNKVKKVLAIRTNLWFDRSNEHVGKEGEGVGEARFVE